MIVVYLESRVTKVWCINRWVQNWLRSFLLIYLSYSFLFLFVNCHNLLKKGSSWSWGSYNEAVLWFQFPKDIFYWSATFIWIIDTWLITNQISRKNIKNNIKTAINNRLINHPSNQSGQYNFFKYKVWYIFCLVRYITPSFSMHYISIIPFLSM